MFARLLSIGRRPHYSIFRRLHRFSLPIMSIPVVSISSSSALYSTSSPSSSSPSLGKEDSGERKAPATSSVAPSVSTGVEAKNAVVRLRPSGERGHGDHGWLNSYHSFSFASYYDPDFENFHSLRVINEDRVSGSRGFATHGHNDAEIFSYVVSGSLAHKDSLGNAEVIARGGVQFTSAGSGVRHSEHNASKTDLVHFVQIWVTPNKKGLKPSYSTVHWDDKDKEGKLCLIVAPESEEKVTTAKFIKINQDIKMYASILKKGETVSLDLPAGRDAYVHLIQDVTGYSSEAGTTAITVGSTRLGGGDGAFVGSGDTNKGARLVITGAGPKAEFLLFDIKASS